MKIVKIQDDDDTITIAHTRINGKYATVTCGEADGYATVWLSSSHCRMAAEALITAAKEIETGKVKI